MGHRIFFGGNWLLFDPLLYQTQGSMHFPSCLFQCNPSVWWPIHKKVLYSMPLSNHKTVEIR